jgi:hypothetical protein
MLTEVLVTPPDQNAPIRGECIHGNLEVHGIRSATCHIDVETFGIDVMPLRSCFVVIHSGNRFPANRVYLSLVVQLDEKSWDMQPVTVKSDCYVRVWTTDLDVLGGVVASRE